MVLLHRHPFLRRPQGEADRPDVVELVELHPVRQAQQGEVEGDRLLAQLEVGVVERPF